MPPVTASEERSYLLVLEGSSSRIVGLPAHGEVVVGGAEACEVRLHDASVAARHARIVLTRAEATVAPIGPECMVTLNGTAVAAPTALASGDTVALGGVTLVFQDTLLSTVRGAVHAAHVGGPGSAREALTSITLGTQRFVVADPAMVRIFALVERLAQSDAPVLITGETGVGKEVAAAALHAWSARRQRPLVTINCAALPDTLLESELFGHERGAFSGAVAAKPGRLENAAGGTVLLDEVGELSAGAQAKLLRVLETKRSNRLGALAERLVDVRIVAATNRSLAEEVKAGRFRQDLYFRLAAATIVLPPLRDRREDLPALARHLLAEACARLPRPPMTIAPAAMLRLASYPWPGNVRELRNVLEVAAAAVAGSALEASHLVELLPATPPARETVAGVSEAGGAALVPPAFRNLYDEIRELERTRIAAALAAAGGVRVRAAALIGMPLRTFVTKLREYGFSDGAGPRPRARA
jgi:two-component system, NtrC family, response regulator AtoC